MLCRMYYRNKSQIHAQYKKSFFHLHRIKISTHLSNDKIETFPGS